QRPRGFFLRASPGYCAVAQLADSLVARVVSACSCVAPRAEVEPARPLRGSRDSSRATLPASFAMRFAMGLRRVIRASAAVALVCAAAAPSDSWAHHSTAEYDSSSIVDAEGVVAKVLWQNPHVRLEIDTSSFDGNAELWHLEGQSP